MFVSILEPSIKRILGDDIEVELHDDDDFIDAVAAVDKIYLNGPIKAKRGSNVINSLLQLIWNSAENEIYDDVGIEGRDDGNRWLSIKNNPFQAIPGNSIVFITPDAGC
ncbi:MAG: hypothetical protein ACTSUE_14115 [Promethearchaeota archaeon]